MDGFIAINKAPGMGSTDVVYKVRKIVHMKRVGHSGTLDPAVNGVLPIALGSATKAISRLQDSGKIYTGSITFGFATTTEDMEGEVVERTPLTVPIPDERIDAAMQSFIGDIIQIPPMYSAVKVNGRRLYDYARAGETVERPQRHASIYDFRRTSATRFDADQGTQTFEFSAHVGKGTYIRTLAVDLGKRLDLAATMTQLTRTESGGFVLEESVTLEQLAAAAEADQLLTLVRPVQHAYAGLTSYALADWQWESVQHGNFLKLPSTDDELILTYQGIMKALYKLDADGSYHPETMYLSNSFGGDNSAN
ncbi:tRNA pseudouridine(55) synthase TruB [Lacticaseibacillus zhaodongensis]|uniref:tRNA pseudouridine(55) synthase TruB n=1 Tax=Lacticaseibacillus zhaodongensis TaxID=2668065 RepID=UPI0012D2EE79|nr:tRNA pseudouridine(55) synthase TruB [Lacticaseibacillus zhaodongensis]